MEKVGERGGGGGECGGWREEDFCGRGGHINGQGMGKGHLGLSGEAEFGSFSAVVSTVALLGSILRIALHGLPALLT